MPPHIPPSAFAPWAPHAPVQAIKLIRKPDTHALFASRLRHFNAAKDEQQLISKLGKVPGRSDVQPTIGGDRAKLRIVSPEDEAKTAYYQKMFDDLLGKAK